MFSTYLEIANLFCTLGTEEDCFYILNFIEDGNEAKALGSILPKNVAFLIFLIQCSFRFL